MLSYPLQRIQRGKRVLKDKSDVLSADFIHFVFGKSQQIPAVKENFTRNPGKTHIVQSHNGHCNGTFTAARFPYNGKHFIRPDIKRNSVDRIIIIAVDTERRVQILNGQ